MRQAQLHSFLPTVANLTFGAAAAIVVANIAFAFMLDTVPGWVMDTFGTGEHNILTWLSSALLLYAALLLTSLALGERARLAESPDATEGPVVWRRWLELALVFYLLSLDETAELHENLTNVMHTFGLGGYLYFAWVIPGAIFALLVFVRVLGLLRTLPSATRRALLASGALYLTGAIGVESVGANHSFHAGEVQDLPFQILCAIEEGLEVLGIWWFLRALAPHCAARLGPEETPDYEVSWAGLLPDIGRAAAVGAAILAVVALAAPQLPRLDSTRLPGLIEAESLRPIKAHLCQTELVRLNPALATGEISGRSLLRLTSLGRRAQQSFALVPPTPGRYRLEMYFARQGTFGQLNVLLNNEPLSTLNLFAPSEKIAATGPINLGAVELREKNVLTLELRHPGRHYAFDGLMLVPVK